MKSAKASSFPASDALAVIDVSFPGIRGESNATPSSSEPSPSAASLGCPSSSSSICATTLGPLVVGAIVVVLLVANHSLSWIGNHTFSS